MAKPGLTDAHVDQLMTILSHAYTQEAENYVADKVFPIVPVRKQSAKIAVYTKADWFMDDAGLRAPGTEPTKTDYGVSTDSYSTENYAIAKDIPDEIRENTDEPFDADIDATRLVTDRLLMKREVKWSADHIKTGVWGVAGSTDKDLSAAYWSDYGLSNPITDIDTGRDTIHSTTAREPNTLVIGRQVWTKLRNHPDLIERIKYVQKGVLTLDLVASLLEVERLFVGRAIRNTAAKGQTATYAYIIGKSGLLAYVAPRPALLTPSAGYTFYWKNFGALSFIRRLRDDKARYDRIEGNTYFDHKVIGADLGYYMYYMVE